VRQPVLDRPHEEVAQLVAEGPGRHGLGKPLRPQGTGARLPVTGEEVGEDEVLLGAGDQPRLGQPVNGGLGTQHGEAEALDRPGERHGGRAGQPGGHGVTQHRRGRAAGPDEDDLVRTALTGAHPVQRSLHRHGGLARARGPEDHDDITAHRHRPTLVGVKLGTLRQGTVDQGRPTVEDDPGHPLRAGRAAGVVRCHVPISSPATDNRRSPSVGPHHGRSMGCLTPSPQEDLR
jgi:hypothetical protein